MTKTDILFNAVSKVTGISKTKMRSRSRLWPVAEARMLFVLFFASLGQSDERTGWSLNRHRTTILNSRHNAEEYITVSKVFKDKFDKVKAFYEKSQSV